MVFTSGKSTLISLHGVARWLVYLLLLLDFGEDHFKLVQCQLSPRCDRRDCKSRAVVVSDVLLAPSFL